MRASIFVTFILPLLAVAQVAPGAPDTPRAPDAPGAPGAPGPPGAPDTSITKTRTSTATRTRTITVSMVSSVIATVSMNRTAPVNTGAFPAWTTPSATNTNIAQNTNPAGGFARNSGTGSSPQTTQKLIPEGNAANVRGNEGLVGIAGILAILALW
ncbi:unnamed protein product [Blumeria hordei]|uniref:Uncharacterized protein n=1 Tax=Blumeria hordei TaxID=2867405 RepID=A0A383UJH7_BLUHO|nr:unnamed protein product [Blumeria hordei]